MYSSPSRSATVSIDIESEPATGSWLGQAERLYRRLTGSHFRQKSLFQILVGILHGGHGIVDTTVNRLRGSEPAAAGGRDLLHHHHYLRGTHPSTAVPLMEGDTEPAVLAE